MGDYTSVKFQATLSEFGLAVVESLLNNHSADNPWKAVAVQFPTIRGIHEYAAKERSAYIPFGDSWGTRYVSGGEWVVACELKNYQDEVEAFLGIDGSEGILPQLTTSTTRVLVDGPYGFRVWTV